MGTKEYYGKAKARRAVARAARAVATAVAGPDPVDVEPDDEPELDDFGVDPDDEEDELPPAPPAPDAEQGQKPNPELVEIARLMRETTDTLEIQKLMYRAVAASTSDVLTDETISNAARRKELRTIAAVAAKLRPDSDLYDARELVLRDRAELEARAKTKRGAKLEKRPPAPRAPVLTVIPGKGAAADPK